MIVGCCEVELMLYEVNSLKEKRHILKSIIQRVQGKFNVAIAETDLNDIWRRSKVGFVCVSTTVKHTNQILDTVLRFIEEDTRVEIIKCERDIV